MVIGNLVVEPSAFFKEPLHYGTRAHTHTRSHLYTYVLISSSQAKLTLRGFNFHCVGTPQYRGSMSPTIAKTKEKEKKKEKEVEKKKNVKKEEKKRNK